MDINVVIYYSHIYSVDQNTAIYYNLSCSVDPHIVIYYNHILPTDLDTAIYYNQLCSFDPNTAIFYNHLRSVDLDTVVFYNLRCSVLKYIRCFNDLCTECQVCGQLANDINVLSCLWIGAGQTQEGGGGIGTVSLGIGVLIGPTALFIPLFSSRIEGPTSTGLGLSITP